MQTNSIKLFYWSQILAALTPNSRISVVPVNHEDFPNYWGSILFWKLFKTAAPIHAPEWANDAFKQILGFAEAQNGYFDFR
jgi:hypothetical protein